MRKRTKIQIRSAASRKAARTRKRMKQARVKPISLRPTDDELRSMPLEVYHELMTLTPMHPTSKVGLIGRSPSELLLPPNPFDEIGA